jgi:hypothetical protein
MTLSRLDRFKMHLHRWITYLACPLMIVACSLIFFLLRYRIRHLAEVRREFARLVPPNAPPTLVCLNHLTRIDSIILALALMSPWKYLFNYSRLPWHVLEARYINFWPLRFLCYLSKTIPVYRMGGRDQVRRTEARVKYRLTHGELVVIFPEGRRSLTGRIDMTDYQYTIGNLLNELPNSQVLCAYLRAENQVGVGEIPSFGAKFDIKLATLKPSTSQSGLRASRDLTGQVMEQLNRMEIEYFETKNRE